MYKVELFQDNTYQVVYYQDYYRDDNFTVRCSDRIVQFQGNLSDCNAWLQLNDKGYL